MHARLLKPSDFRAMPWKNGSGMTTELAIEPEGATLESGFQWRLSMADVREDGPFSAYPGYERTLMLVKGRGIELDFGGNGRQRLERTFEPVAFSGDWTASGRLLEGPCRDFNIITRRGLTQRVSVLHPDPRAVVPAAPTLLLFCAQGKARVMPAGHMVGHNELLRLDGADAVEINAEAPETLVVAVAIAPEAAD